MTEHNRNRLSLSPYLSGPLVSLYPDVSHQNTHAIPTHLLYFQLSPTPHAQVHTLQAWFVYLRVHLQIAGLTDHTPLLSLLTFAILPCVTAYLCRRTERESDKSRTVGYVSVYVAGTDEQLKTCQPDILQKHEAQSRSRRAEPMQCIKSDIGWWWWWWGSYYAEKNYY